MQKTCPNCNRSFEIDQNMLNMYEAAQRRASEIEWQAMPHSFANSINEINLYNEKISKANYIRNSAPNPYICPYCGHDTKNSYSYSSGSNNYSSNNSSSVSPEFAMLVAVILTVLLTFCS